jgi:hypothetical protein
MLARKSAAAIGVLATTVGFAGCGGGSSSSGVTAAAYVKSVCNAVGPFEKDVTARSSALNPTSIKSPAEGKTALQGFLTAVAGDTDKALSQLKSAGKPSVTNGKQIEAAIVQAFTQLDSAMKKAATSANSLPTTSATAFQAAATTLGTTVRTSMSGIGSSLSGLKSPELQKAAAKEPACSTLNG